MKPRKRQKTTIIPKSILFCIFTPVELIKCSSWEIFTLQPPLAVVWTVFCFFSYFSIAHRPCSVVVVIVKLVWLLRIVVSTTGPIADQPVPYCDLNTGPIWNNATASTLACAVSFASRSTTIKLGNLHPAFIPVPSWASFKHPEQNTTGEEIFKKKRITFLYWKLLNDNNKNKVWPFLHAYFFWFVLMPL